MNHTYSEQTIGEELQALCKKVFELERKLEETIEVCDAWQFFKHFVYLALIIIPSCILLTTLSLIMAHENQ